MSKPSLSQYPITELKGVGPKMAERLLKLGITTVQDMLFHLPLRYEDRTRIYAISELTAHSHVTVQATIETSQITFGKRRMLVCQINDGTGRLTLRFFNFTAAQKNAFSAGKIIRCFGEIRRGRVGFEMNHPEYSISDTFEQQPTSSTLTPVYSTTEGLKQLSIRALSEQAIELLQKYAVEELLPQQWQPSQLGLSDALLLLHRPPNDVDIIALEQGTHPAQQRLVFEELLAQNLSLLKVREQGQQVKAVALEPTNSLETQFLAQLPFAPTNAQSRVVSEIKEDMQHAYPMMRLVQGDVGSGKTLVAALSALTAIAKGYQVALMAPTEILSEQHGINFSSWFESLGITVAWLGGKTKGKERVSTLAMIASGEAQMIIGTHALFQDEVEQRNILAVPAVYLNGEPFSQGAISLTDILNKVDSKGAQRQAASLNEKSVFDVLVVGGGPAGASAAIYSARKGLNTGVVAERFGGQVADTLAIENFISIKATQGPKMVAQLEEHVKEYDVDVMHNQRAANLQKGSNGYDITLENGAVLKAKSLVLATGARWREMNVPGEQQYKGHGVAYCPHCDGPLSIG